MRPLGREAEGMRVPGECAELIAAISVSVPPLAV
jgi:hypothetical protein